MMRANLKLLVLLPGLLGMVAAYATPGEYAQGVYEKATQSLSRDDKETLNRILDSLDTRPASPSTLLKAFIPRSGAKTSKTP